MRLVLAAALFAQTVWPQPQQWAYTTADPVRADQLGLATQQGRYSFALQGTCEWMAADLNVAFYATDDYLTQWIVPKDGDESTGCLIMVQQRMSDVPCFTVDDVCDIAAEADE